MEVVGGGAGGGGSWSVPLTKKLSKTTGDQGLSSSWCISTIIMGVYVGIFKGLPHMYTSFLDNPRTQQLKLVPFFFPGFDINTNITTFIKLLVALSNKWLRGIEVET